MGILLSILAQSVYYRMKKLVKLPFLIYVHHNFILFSSIE